MCVHVNICVCEYMAHNVYVHVFFMCVPVYVLVCV